MQEQTECADDFIRIIVVFISDLVTHCIDFNQFVQDHFPTKSN